MIYNEFSVTAMPWSRYMRTRLSGFSILIFGAILPLAVSAGAIEKSKPLTLDSAEVKQVVLAKLREPGPEDIERIKRLIKAMVSAGEGAQKRDRAIKGLLADYAFFRRACDSIPFEEFRLSKEEQNRLEQIYSSSKEMTEAERKFETAGRLVISKGLLDQPDYLIRLLKETKGRDEAAVAKRLRKVTGQTFGQDVPAWKKWWSGQRIWGKFEQVAPEVGNLIRFKIIGKGLRLDREHWVEVAKKTDKEQLRKRYLANCFNRSSRKKNWALKRAKDAVEGLDSRLVFTRLALAAEGGGVGLRSLGKTRFSFRFGGSGGAFKGVFSRWAETIAITLEERSGPRRRLEVWDNGAGGLRIMLTSLTDGSALMIRQRQNGNFSVGQAGTDGCVNFREDSFVSFCRKYRQYADKQVFSRLRRLGIGFPALPKTSDSPAAQVRPAVPPADSGKAHWKTGLLQQIPDDVGRFIALAVSRKRIGLDKTHWRRVLKGQDLEKLRAKQEELGMLKFFDERHFQDRRGWTKEHLELARECGFAMRLFHQACAQKWYRGGGSGGLGSGGSMTMDFSISSGLRAHLAIQKDMVHIVLDERKSPSRNIEIFDDGQGAMRILVMREDGTAALLINQAGNGRFAVTEAMNEQFFVAGAESFKAFSDKYPRYVNERMFGYLRHFGILTPPDPYSKAVRDVVLLRLTGLSEQETRRAWHLIAQLDDIQYHKQEAAARILTERLSHYREVLEEATRSKSLSTGAKTRIKQIFVEALEADRIEQAIDGRGLLDDVDYLIKLMGKTKGQTRKAVENRLEKITGKDLGEDTKTWQEWWSKKQTEQSD